MTFLTTLESQNEGKLQLVLVLVLTFPQVQTVGHSLPARLSHVDLTPALSWETKVGGIKRPACANKGKLSGCRE